MITIVLSAFITVLSSGGLREKGEARINLDISSIRSSHNSNHETIHV